MGWLIVTLILCILFTTLNILDEKYDWDNTTLEACSVIGAAASFTATLIILLCMVDLKGDAKVKIEDYNNTVELVQTLGVPSDAVMQKTLDLNQMITRNKVRSHNFWTLGLYSKEVGALPLLEIPESMKKLPIE